jgi:hypothetical protein
MTNSEKIQKLRIRVAYLWGLGIGVTVTALQLAPKTSSSGDKYMVTTVFGVIVMLLAGGMTWYVRRQEVAAQRKDNIATLIEKKD